MKLHWQKTPFTWIASKIPFQHKSRFVIEEEKKTPDDVYKLTMKLLEVGGESVCVRFPEPEMKLILKNGRLFPIDGLRIEPGDENECHSNCSNIWLQNKRRLSICTGYGLTDDDQMWRQHTWLQERQDQTLLETTLLREKYYGIELSCFRAFIFSVMNK